MRGTAALKSIEALYKEAETVIADGVPMVAIVKSAPPVATPDIPVATRASESAPQDSPDHAPRDMPPAQTTHNARIAGSDHKAATRHSVFDRIEKLSAMAATLDIETGKADLSSATGISEPVNSQTGNYDHHDGQADAAPASSLPSAPPVPDYAAGSRRISDAELEDVVKKAVDDIVATTPIDSVIAGNERIESVMADIAEAVGKAESADAADPAADPAPISSSPISTSPAPASPTEHDAVDAGAVTADPAPATDTSDTRAPAPARSAAQLDLIGLNDIVANTVKSVIREELSNLVQSTVKSTLDELRASQADPAKDSTSDR